MRKALKYDFDTEDKCVKCGSDTHVYSYCRTEFCKQARRKKGPAETTIRIKDNLKYLIDVILSIFFFKFTLLFNNLSLGTRGFE
ncbi:hypothetical protein BH23THE1_BH23THE1_19190 [soil metagenome]